MRSVDKGRVDGAPGDGLADAAWRGRGKILTM